MWGSPVRDLAEIAQFCSRRGLQLLEDCSHAHGAHLVGKLVGTFGNAASWSLQGQKIVSGGEGGIMLTDDEAIYDRALLQGHYNKRPLQEISIDNPLRRFYLTGMGLKLRAHPLAVAIARQQFAHLDDFIAVKQEHAEILTDALRDYPFLQPPSNAPDTRNSWYAYVLQYDQEYASGVSRQDFVHALHCEGLIEADIPGSTILLDQLPLFQMPEQVIPRMHTARLPNQPAADSFPRAREFYERAIKFPVWAYESDRAVVVAYANGIRKVASYVQRHGTLERKP
jgi:perosamine synthetase